MTHDPVPQRLSDAERDAAASMLRDHFEAGRLDAAEFDERLSAALAARVASEFTPLFADLPHPHPDAGGVRSVQPWSPSTQPGAQTGSLPAPRPTPNVPATGGSTDWLGVAKGVIWPAAIIMAIMTGNWMTFIVIAIIGSIVLSQISGNQRKPPPYLGR